LKKDHKISQETAKKEALDIMSLFDNHNSLKNYKITNREISSSQTIYFDIHSNPFNFKSGNAGSKKKLAVHIFNFSDNKNKKAGYALVSGDDRLPAVLGCSDKSELKKKVENPGLAVFLSKTPKYIERKINEYESEKKEQLNNTIEKLNKQLPDKLQTKLLKQEESKNNNLKSFFFGLRWVVSNFKISSWRIVKRYGPFISKKVNWGQYSPYNSKLPFCDDHKKRVVTGCVATAVAQIMAYHKHPKYFKGVYYNWKEMTAEHYARKLPYKYKNQVAKLFKEIGKKENTDY
jgi:hypothetical protein